MDSKKIGTDIAVLEHKIAVLPKMHYSHVFSGFDKSIEPEFYNDFYESSIGLIRVALMLGFTLVAAFGILDIWILPLGKNIAWLLRFAVICPFIMCCFIFSFFPFFKKIMQASLSIVCLISAVGISIMIAIARDTEAAYNLYYVGLIEVLMFLYALCRIRFVYACVIGWSIVFVYEYVAIFHNRLLASLSHVPVFFNNNFFLVTFNVMGMIACFFIEYYIRYAFILRKRIQYEEELEKLRIEKQSKQKSDFFINLSHEIKTPITLIQNILCDLQRKYKEDRELSIIDSQVAKLASEIVNIFNVQKVEQGQALYDHNQITDMSNNVRQKIALFKYAANKKNITIDAQLAPKLYIKIDPFALESIINNILDNAIRYTGRNGRVEILLKENKNKNKIMMIVKDNGQGMPPEQQEHLFEKYYQLSREKKNYQGLGLGLFIVKQVMDSIGGNIEIKSDVNKGTEICLAFECYVGKSESSVMDYMPGNDSREASFELLPEIYRENRKTIFLVEDNTDMIYLMQNNLADDYNVFFALNGKEALEKISGMNKPDLIISDIMMDEMDGYEFYDRFTIDENHQDIPFIFLTALTKQDDKVLCLKKGAIDFISKPFNMEELKLKVQAILKNRAQAIEQNIAEMEKKITSVLRQESAGRIRQLSVIHIYEEYGISSREKEIIHLVLEGLENKEIGAKLNLSASTVKNHISSIYQKCKIQNRVELANLFNQR